MKKSRLVLLSVLAGVMLCLSWPPYGFPVLSFFAFVPLFFVSEELVKRKVRFPFWNGVLFSFISFLIWNVGTTWWIWNITPVGSLATFILNAFFMSLFFGCWQRFRSLELPPVTAPLAFIAFWCSWEYLHLNWDITWPWLNLGNVFSSCPQFVQWYEFTGAFGGTVWILVANFLAFHLLRHRNFKTETKLATSFAVSLVLWIALPAVGSLIRYSTYKLPVPNPKNSIEAVVVQQNTDPVEEQYEMSNLEHAERLWTVARPQITPQTRLLVCPETAIPWGLCSDAIGAPDCPVFNSTYAWLPLMDSLSVAYPKLNVILGLSTYRIFDYKATITSHEVAPKTFVDSYNTAAYFTRNGLLGTYYKSKLVPGVEKMPYPQIFGFLEKLAIDLGGTSGSLGTDTVQRTFQLPDVPFKVGTAICYESAYGEHFGHFVRNGAQLMTVITNDGWWGNTPGYKQHFLFSKLRAVETRRTILRAANTGVSGLINERGDAVVQTEYATRLAFRANVCPNGQLTFYVRFGDYIARFCVGLSVLIVLFGAFLRIRKRISRK